VTALVGMVALAILLGGVALARLEVGERVQTSAPPQVVDGIEVVRPVAGE